MGDRTDDADERPREETSPSSAATSRSRLASSTASDATRRAHDATLRFEYKSRERARVIARAVAQEVGEIDGDRSAATVERDGPSVAVRVVADDLVALRAGCNTWGSLVEVAERTSRPG